MVNNSTNMNITNNQSPHTSNHPIQKNPHHIRSGTKVFCVVQAQTCGGIKPVNCFHNDIIHFGLGKHININKTKGERVPQDYLPNCKRIFFNYYFTEGYLLFWSK